jgi:AhpD family alkylhydroperoxidase
MKENAETLVKELAAAAEILGSYSPRSGQFSAFTRHVFEEGALSPKVKRLIALGAAITRGCEWCIATHVKKAIEAGATRQEILETCLVAVVMSGGPAMAYSKIAIDAAEEFSRPPKQT